MCFDTKILSASQNTGRNAFETQFWVKIIIFKISIFFGRSTCNLLASCHVGMLWPDPSWPGHGQYLIVARLQIASLRRCPPAALTSTDSLIRPLASCATSTLAVGHVDPADFTVVHAWFCLLVWSVHVSFIWCHKLQFFLWERASNTFECSDQPCKN